MEKSKVKNEFNLCLSANISDLKLIFKIAKEKHNKEILDMVYIMKYFKDNRKAYRAVFLGLENNIIEKIEYTECPHCYHLDIFDEENNKPWEQCSRCKSLYMSDSTYEMFKLIND